MTQAGRFDRLATIERLATESDPEWQTDSTYGTPIPVWVPIDGYETGSPSTGKKVWGQRMDMLPSRDEELGVSGAVVGKNRTRWRMRWRSDLTSGMRVTIHEDVDTVWQIIGGPAEYGGRHEQVELLLERYTSDG